MSELLKSALAAHGGLDRWDKLRSIRATLSDGLLRRLEYSVDVLGGAKALNYPSDYRDFNGILLPMKRRVYPVDVRRQKVAEPVLVAIDLFEVTIQ